MGVTAISDISISSNISQKRPHHPSRTNETSSNKTNSSQYQSMQNCSGQLPRLCFSSCAFLSTPRFLSGRKRACHQMRRARTTAVADVEIHSLKNPRVKDARALLRRRQREKEGRILLEGQRLIADALEAGVEPREFFCTRESLERSNVNCALKESILRKGAEGFLVSDNVIRSFSDTVNPQVWLPKHFAQCLEMFSSQGRRGRSEKLVD